MDSKERKWSRRELLPDHSNLVLLSVEAVERGWLVHAESDRSAHYPLCGVRSTQRHSRYWRTLRDLPVQGNAITCPPGRAVAMSKQRLRAKDFDRTGAGNCRATPSANKENGPGGATDRARRNL